jgi:Prokaryotic Cytochrome C oxidase subunit IV
MSAIVNTKETYIWIFLALLTLVSWLLGDSYVADSRQVSIYLTSGLILLAFFKIRLVIMYFMEIANAPLPLRVLFEVWVVAVPVVIISLYLML